jgi:Fe-S-cluster containining protein
MDFAAEVLIAAGRPEVCTAVRAIYDAVQIEVDERRPVCVMSGRCCHFEEYGHRLFVTTMEMAYFVNELAGRENHPALATGHRLQLANAWDGTGCPFQLNKLCSAHAMRPFGCRMFFCDETSTLWQNEQYERFHGDMKRLHADLGVPYAYVEWRAALRNCLGDRPGDRLAQRADIL